MENEEVRDEFTCSVCWQLLDDPHVLQCGHYFCFKCLSDTSDTVSDYLHCPKCRVMITHMPTSFEEITTVTKILYPKTYLERADEIENEDFDVEPLEMNTKANGLTTVWIARTLSLISFIALTINL